MIKIPHELLSAEALLGVIDEFIGREGTDYGHRDFTIAEKRAALMRALEGGRAIVVFDPVSETTTLIDAADVPRQKGDE